jgi:hypothetical protein
MYKDPSLPGPPWGLNGVHWDLLARGGDGIANIVGKTTEDERTLGAEETGDFTRIVYVRPTESYEVAQGGTDMLSVYLRK